MGKIISTTCVTVVEVLTDQIRQVQNEKRQSETRRTLASGKLSKKKTRFTVSPKFYDLLGL